MNVHVPYFSSPVTQQCTQWGVTHHPTFATALQLEKEMRLLQIAKIGCIALKVISAIAIGAIVIAAAVCIEMYAGDLMFALLPYETMSMTAQVAAEIFADFGAGIAEGIAFVTGAFSFIGIWYYIRTLENSANNEILNKQHLLAGHMNTLQGARVI
jgi:hypothetical protein